jgi:16S rRNA (guanine1516-N2)-methyltransferase
MFPTGRKTQEKKPMRVLRALVGDDGDAAAMLEAARLVAQRRVAVNRPAQGPPLGDEPDVVTRGKGFRYDVYLRHGGRRTDL